MTKTLLLVMTSLSALIAAAPADAQYPASYGAQRPYRGAGADIAMRIDRLEERLEAGVRAGTIDRREAWMLRRQIAEIRRLEREFGYDGLSLRERDDLQLRIRTLRDRMGFADGGARGRYAPYDRNRDGNDDRYDADGNDIDDRYDRNHDGNDDRYDADGNDIDDRFDRNDDGNDDRYDADGDDIDDRFDRNRDGNDDRYDRDGDDIDDRSDPYVGEQDPGGGLIGVRIGDRPPAGLGAVPPQYRPRYSDGAGRIFRSDGVAIYEIDVRTNTIVQIYPMS